MLKVSYPSVDIFMKVKKYDTPVWKSRVPLLIDYLSDAVQAVGEQLSQVGAASLVRQAAAHADYL